MGKFVPANRELENVQIERLAIAQDSTANAGAFSWINPTERPVHAQVTYAFTTAGTGTIDIGVSDDGTGAAADIIDGGTMAVGVVTSQRTGGGTAGATAWFRIEASGTAGDSIVAKHNDTETSTAVGKAYIVYYVA